MHKYSYVIILHQTTNVVYSEIKMKVNEITNLKQRIDKNYKKLQRKYFLTKYMLTMLNDLINGNTSDKEIYQWLEKHNNIIFGIEYNLNIIEQKNNKSLQRRK